MKVISIDGYKSLKDKMKGAERSYLMLYKSGNSQSECALENMTQAAAKVDGLTLMSADVSQVRDIHPEYGIKSVPSLIAFEKGEYKNLIKGCQSVDYYVNLFEESLFTASAQDDEKPQKRVTVYSTPTCSWCNTLKSHLRQHRIRFTDVDVSRDQAAAQAMVQRSGQQGVPQTDIDGEIIIGFDKKRINELLNIQG